MIEVLKHSTSRVSEWGALHSGARALQPPRMYQSVNRVGCAPSPARYPHVRESHTACRKRDRDAARWGLSPFRPVATLLMGPKASSGLVIMDRLRCAGRSRLRAAPELLRKPCKDSNARFSAASRYISPNAGANICVSSVARADSPQSTGTFAHIMCTASGVGAVQPGGGRSSTTPMGSQPRDIAV